MDGCKSVLDGVPINDNSYHSPSTIPLVTSKPSLSVVGHCPSCGADIYGPKTIQFGEAPISVHSCTCWRRRGVVENMETK